MNQGVNETVSRHCRSARDVRPAGRRFRLDAASAAMHAVASATMATAVSAMVAATLGGCAAYQQMSGPPSRRQESAGEHELTALEQARAALAAGDLVATEAALAEPLAVKKDPKSSDRPAAIRQTPDTPALLVIRARLRIRQGRFPEAESDALTAMALVPATEPATTEPSGDSDADADPGARKAEPLTQRSVHVTVAEAYENAGRDDEADTHLKVARGLCLQDAELVAAGECDRERRNLIRLRVARGRYKEAEPLVLAGISDVQQRFGTWDIRLSSALCDAARFYARQGKYDLSAPLFSRLFDLWKTVHEDALAEYRKALAAGQSSPFDAEYLRPRAGHFPFTAPCGLEDQPSILYKLGKAVVAAEAIRYEESLWATDTEAGATTVAYLEGLVTRGADPLEIASARHAVGFIAQRKGDLVRAETELRLVSEAYAAAWPNLPISERRYRSEDQLRALESLIELLRSSRRFAEALALGQRAIEVADSSLDVYDALRLDTLESLARTYREMREPEQAESSAAAYLEAVRSARGDRSADYAWALRSISYAYLLRDELDASERMEMQAKAIWAKQSTVAPQF